MDPIETKYCPPTGTPKTLESTAVPSISRMPEKTCVLRSMLNFLESQLDLKISHKLAEFGNSSSGRAMLDFCM